MIDSLSRTRPWVLFMGILTMLGCALLLLMGLAIVVVGRMSALRGLGPMPGGALFGVAYLLTALLCFFPGFYLLRYGSAIKRIGPANAAAMEEALERQASFWRFVGILSAVVVIIYVAAIVIIGALAVQSTSGIE